MDDALEQEYKDIVCGLYGTSLAECIQEEEVTYDGDQEIYDADTDVNKNDIDDSLKNSQNASVLSSVNTSVQECFFLEPSVYDNEEAKKVDMMYGEGANECCKMKCNQSILKQSFMDLEKREQDLIILGHLQLHRHIHELQYAYGQFTKRRSSRHYLNDKDMQRQDVSYYFADMPVCRIMYCFLYDLGAKRYRNLLRHFDERGIEPRQHGSVGRAPTRTNILTKEDKDAVINFITAFSERTAIPLPGRMPNHKDFRVVKLLSNESKLSVYRRYVEASKDQSWKTAGARSFVNLWNKHVPFITTMRPKTDLCAFCQSNVLKLQRAANMNDPKKEAVLIESMSHMRRARVQREYYNSWREKSKKGSTTEIDGVPRTFSVLSFDFSQNIHYPSSPQQVGLLYFLTPRKCNVFGVHDERTGIQVNYLIDEFDMVKKGANIVISLLDYHLHQINSEVLILFADNCVGQNKNNAMIQYLYYRLLMKKNMKIEYNFLLAGHTKFSPDRNFGLMKAKYALKNVDCLDDAVQAVFASSPNGFIVAVATFDPVTNERVVPWSYWDTFLLTFFKKFPGMLQYHHFIFTNETKLLTKTFADEKESPVELQITSLETIEASVIEDMVPEGPNAQRQWYLYDQIRQFCTDPTKSDFIAPRPSVLRPTTSKKETKTANSIDPSTVSGEKDQETKIAPRKRGRPRKTDK